MFVKHLRVFLSLCYRGVLEERKKYPDDRSEPMILVGYHETNAYRLYNPTKYTIIVSIYIIVCDSKSWDLSNYQGCTTLIVPIMIYEE